MIAFKPGLEDFPYDPDANCAVEDWLRICQLRKEMASRGLEDEEMEESD